MPNKKTATAHIILSSVLVALLGGLALPAQGQEAAKPAPPAQATLALEELLRLHRQVQEARDKEEPQAPSPATVSKLELEGRLLEDALEVELGFAVAVLAEERWVQVPLLKMDPDTHLSSLPQVDGGEFVLAEGTLNFVTRRAGRYEFKLSLLKEARRDGPRRKLSLPYPGAALAVLKLNYDERLFSLVGPGIRHHAEGATIYPRDGSFHLAWERSEQGPVPEQLSRPKRPPMESKIVSARASLVATLEGRLITRLAYELQLEGEQSLHLELPSGLRVDKVYLNGAAIEQQTQQGGLVLTVKPPRAGDQTAQLEILMLEDKGALNLSGRLDFSFPKVSWPLDEMFLSVHLPKVFNYGWAGGSLSPSNTAGGESFTHRLPTPGKRLLFHQQLIHSAPTLAVDYTVDLRGQYFTGSGRGHQVPATQPQQPVQRAEQSHGPQWQEQ